MPSRARQRAREGSSPATDVSYVRLTLAVDAIHGAPPGSYFVRWKRGSAAKVSAARALDGSGSFGESLSMYARVKREAGELVSADEVPELSSKLELVRLAPGEDGATVEKDAQVMADVDIGYLLQTMADSGKKNTRTSVRFEDGSLAELTVSSKALGEGTLNSLGSDPDMGSPPDVERADSELVNMRNALRLRADQIDALASRADQLSGRILSAEQSPNSANASASELRDLSERVRDLEVQKSAVEKQRADAQKKVDAHVAHATKIKATYNQLAGWYNNLRSEYAELQARAKSQGSSFTGGPAHAMARELSESNSLKDEEVEKLREERDALRKELDKEKVQKIEEEQNNAELLAAKERALEGIRMQWDSTKSDILAAEQNAAEHRRAAEQAMRELEDTKVLLEEARGQMTSAMVKSRREVERLEEEKKVELEEVRRQTQVEYKRIADQEMENVERRHAEVVSNLAQQSTDKDGKLQTFETRVAELTKVSEDLESEIETLRHTSVAERRSLLEQSEKQQVEAERNRKETLHKFAMEKENEMGLLKEEHEKELKALSAETEAIVHRETVFSQEKSEEAEHYQNEISNLRSKLEKASSEAQSHSESLSEEVAKLKEELVSLAAENRKLQKEKLELATQSSELQETSRSMSEAQAQSDAQLQELTASNDSLKREVVAKEKDAAKMIRLLEEFEAENDEQRLLVTRLRRERDDVRLDFQEAKQISKQSEREQRRYREQIANMQVSHKADIEHLKDERDQSIRELFKVRKTLNSELKQLKKERSSFVQEFDEFKASKAQLETELCERDNMLSSIQLENDELKTQLEAAQSEATERESSLSKDRAAAESVANERVISLKSQLDTMQKELDLSRSALHKVSEDVQTEREHATVKENELRDIISKLESDESTRNLMVTELEEKLSAEQKEKEKFETELSIGLDRLKEAQDGEEKVQRDLASELAKSAALSGELMSLKESMAAVKGSSSSTEQHLRNAQRELAEVRAQKEALVSDVSSLTAASEAAAARASETETRIVGDLESSRQKISELNEELFSHKKRNMELESKASTADQESFRTLARVRAKDEQLESARKESERLQRDIQELQTDMNNVAVNAKASEHVVVALRKQIEAVETEKKATTTQLRSATEKLKYLEGSVEEKASFASRLETGIREKEDSIEKLEKEKRDIARELEDIRDAAETSKSELEEQSMSAKLLAENLSSARAEVEKLREDLVAERTARSSKEEEIENSSNEVQELRAKLERLAEEFDEEIRTKSREIKDLQLDITEKDGTSSSLQDNLRELQFSLQNKEDDAKQMRALLEKLTGENKEIEEENKDLSGKYTNMKQKLSEEAVQKSAIEEELKSVADEKEVLKGELDYLQERVTSLEQLEKVVQKDKRDHKRASTMQTELMNQRARAEKAEADNASLRRKNKELAVRVETHTNSVDLSGDQTLELLIDARMNNANQQEEIARLRNELHKVSKTADKEGMGSSFEKKRSKK